MDEKSQVIGVLGIIVDIIEQKKVELFKDLITEAIEHLGVTIAVADTVLYILLYWIN